MIWTHIWHTSMLMLQKLNTYALVIHITYVYMECDVEYIINNTHYWLELYDDDNITWNTIAICSIYNMLIKMLLLMIHTFIGLMDLNVIFREILQGVAPNLCLLDVSSIKPSWSAMLCVHQVTQETGTPPCTLPLSNPRSCWLNHNCCWLLNPQCSLVFIKFAARS